MGFFFEFDYVCEKNACKDLKLPGSLEAAIAYAIEERIRRPRHSRSIGTISPTTSVSKLNKSELARVKRERLIQTKTSTTKSYEENWSIGAIRWL